ncbi:pentapeptide repeat-containing protein [Priestia megaterium]|uniref:pentapeptide repeat-containing protein n=1 Tax=Priestia megaterium TaxID=1404 RepID=UPI0028621C4C|nr:pentapeptide repeat-containing protein [Priestia megaterium]MDR7241511.1 uncharacterized protein YjbI with pentapeptide repeats [Priestia megaterium]
MNEKIKNHVHNILAPYQDVKNVQDLEEELSQNLQEKFTDYKKDGHNEEQAYYMTINSIGDITELIQSMNVETKELKQTAPMDFSKTELIKSDFRSVSVYKGKFNASNLNESDFSYADLTDCMFKSSNLTKAIFHHVNLTGVQFKWANFKQASFKDCIYDNTYFKQCNLTDIVFDEETFNGTIFEGTSLKKASFRNATLLNVQFRGSDLKKSDFEGAKMDKLTYNFLKSANIDLSKVTMI